MTPYEEHKKKNHETTTHSPNGLDRIEECKECKARFLWPATNYTFQSVPVTLYPRKGA